MKTREQMTVDERWTCIAFGWVSFDQPSGAYITRSSGRRRVGRPAKYFFYKDGKIAWKGTAYTEEEAVNKVNKWVEEQR
jgi:hypothetical protein